MAEERTIAADAVEELALLREAVATYLRYIEGEVVEGLRSGRHTREVAANIAGHQARNLRVAAERTGRLEGQHGRSEARHMTIPGKGQEEGNDA